MAIGEIKTSSAYNPSRLGVPRHVCASRRCDSCNGHGRKSTPLCLPECSSCPHRWIAQTHKSVCVCSVSWKKRCAAWLPRHTRAAGRCAARHRACGVAPARAPRPNGRRREAAPGGAAWVHQAVERGPDLDGAPRRGAGGLQRQPLGRRRSQKAASAPDEPKRQPSTQPQTPHRPHLMSAAQGCRSPNVAAALATRCSSPGERNPTRCPR